MNISQYYCKDKGVPCQYANSNGYCVISACIYSETWNKCCIVPKIAACLLPDEIKIDGVTYVRKTEFANDKED